MNRYYKWNFRPLKLLWCIIIAVISVYVYGWGVLIPLLLITIDIELRK